MPRAGFILETKGEHARISTTRRGICSGCSEKSSCAFDNALGEGSEEVIVALNPIQAAAGEYVEFDLTGHMELKVSMIVWVVPLIGLSVGAFLGSYLHGWLGLSTDAGTLLGVVAGFLAAFLPVMALDRRSADNRDLVPLISKVLPPTACSDIKLAEISPSS